MKGLWQAFTGIVYKDFLQARRDKSSLRQLVIMQVFQFLMLAWIDLNIRNMPLVIVDQDRTSESRELVERLGATQAFDIKFVTSSQEQARQHIQAGRAKVAVVIPPNFGQARTAAVEASLLVLVDGSDSTSSAQAVAAIDGVAGRINLEIEAEEPGELASVTAHSVLLFNPQGRMSSFMLPGLLAMLLGGSYSARIIRSIMAERDGGNLERLLMTPMNYNGLILGKLVPWFILGWFNAMLYLIVIRWGFSVPIRGSVALLIAGATLYVLTIVALGAFVAAGSRTMGEANMLYQIILFPATLLSGYIFPIYSVPRVLLPISYALPQTHFIELMRGICLRGAEAKDLLPNLLYLGLAPIVLITFAARRFARTVLQ